MLYSRSSLLLARTNHDAALLRDPVKQAGSIPRSHRVTRKHHILPLSVNVYPESLIRTRYYETTKQIGHFTFSYVIGLARRMPGYTQVIAEGIDNESMFSLRQLYELVRFPRGC